MEWFEFVEYVYMLMGAAGVPDLDFTTPELCAIAEGKDRTQWRHTTLIYDSGTEKNQATFKAMYPYPEDFRVEPTEQNHKASVQRFKRIIESSK